MFAVALLLTALSRDFGLLLVSFVLFYPASGAFVSLSQATLMDLQPSRREQNMARWTLAGSIGVVAGWPLLGHAWAERHDAGGQERLGLGCGIHPTGAGADCAAAQSPGCDVAPAAGASNAADRLAA